MFNEITAFSLIMLVQSIGAAGGIGGGSVTVPILILLIGFEPKIAIPLTNLSIFGSACVSLFYNFTKPHPTLTCKGLVDWDFILMFEPITMVGAIIGVLFNIIFPETFIVIALNLVLSFIGIKIIINGIRTYRLETKENNRAKLNLKEYKTFEVFLLI
jgi:uncharacterized membrane protein YfcA